MIHDGGDGDQNCADPLDRIMGTEYAGWSTCSAEAMVLLVE